jgi:two-component system, HptB-dependent secretion and biofilm response regulator
MSEHFKSLKILAADDNKTNLHIIKVFLTKLGHDAILAENGQEAVQKFIAEQPDMILMDIMMPIMDGFEASRQIKALCKEHWTPLIFVSAMSRDENLVEGLEAGGDDYLTKPINFVVLEAKIRSMQRSLEMQRQAGEALKQLQTVSDAVMDVILTLDEEGNIVNSNKSVEAIFKCAPSSLIGKPITSLLKNNFQGNWFKEVLLNTQGQQAIEVIGVRPDGSPLTVEVSLSSVAYEGSLLYVSVLRDITERKEHEEALRRNAEQLQTYYEHTEAEQALAKNLVEKQLHRPGLQDPAISYWVAPNSTFSGDVVAGMRTPDGKYLYALLADATGHGLGAAISVLPVLSIFYRMTKLSVAVSEIIAEVNQQLKESVPTGRFVAATFARINIEAGTGEIWMGGACPALLIDNWGRPVDRFSSTHLPLGVLHTNAISCEPQAFEWKPGYQLLFCSDGLIEAENSAGVPYGEEGLLNALAHTAPQDRMAKIHTTLIDHLGSEVPQDDVSVMLIDCK